MKNTAIFLLLAIIALQGCKYEEGPGISFRSRKERVVNFWKLTTVINNGTDVTSLWFEEILTFKGVEFFKDNTCKIYIFPDFGPTSSISGTWSFTNKDEGLIITNVIFDPSSTYDILKLKETELWLRDNLNDTDPNTYLTFKFEPK